MSSSVLTLVLAAAALSACSESVDPPLGRSAEPLTQTLTIRRGTFGTVADTTISASARDKNFGTQKQLQVSAKNEALLRFELGSIPANAVIQSANLTLAINGGEGESDDDGDDGDHEGNRIAPIKLHRVTAAWAEGSVTYRSFNQQFAPAVAGTILLANRTSSKTVDVLALVQGWVAGTYPNFGLVLVTAGKQHTLVVSSEHPTIARRPTLEIRYAVPENHCAPNPCAHGTCANTLDSFTCACDQGFDGATCAHDIDDCAPNPCQNLGVCTDGVNGFTCACADGYTGLTCGTDVDDCAANPCLNGGTCTDGVNSHTCTCLGGFSGADCEIVDTCSTTPNPCQNGGACTLLPGNTYTCACPIGFIGAHCETNPNNCPVDACSGHGSCADGQGTYTCTCDPGYTGTDCQTVIDHCGPNPCINGGTCTNANNAAGFTCACATGYDGLTCEHDINDCAASPCQNGGACIDGLNSYTCTCAGYYTGTNCEIPPVCGAGQMLTGVGCVPCPAGTYSANGAACLACPDGTISSDLGSRSCIACPAGTGADSAHTSCSACPWGSASTGDGVCVACPDQSNLAQTACVTRTGLNVVAQRGPAGSNLQIYGLLAAPPATQVAGATIDFVVSGPGGLVIHQSADTDLSGVASITVNVPAGQYSITATFFGDQTYGASIGLGTLVADPAGTALDALTISGAGGGTGDYLGDGLRASTVLSRLSPPMGPVSGAGVTFTATDPDGLTSSVSTLTGVGGQASANLPATKRGQYQLGAQFAGDSYLAPTSASISWIVYEKTFLTLPNATGQAGQPIQVTAQLADVPSNAPIAGQTVVFGFGGVVPPVSALTDASGIAHVNVTIPLAGLYSLSATFANNAGYFTDAIGSPNPTTALATLTITPPPACPAGAELDPVTLTCNLCAPGTASNGNGVCVTCPAGTNAGQTACLEATRLVVAGATGWADAPIELDATLTTTAGAPIAGELVDFLVMGFGPIAHQAALTDANGLAVITVSIPVVGNGYQITGAFAGSQTFAASSGQAQLNLMKAMTQLDPVTITGSGFVGDGLSLSTLLFRLSPPAGPVANRIVTFSSTAPNTAVSSVATTTGPDGRASVSIQATQRGRYQFGASFSGDNGLSGTDSVVVSYNVYQKAQLVVSDAAGQAGAPLQVSARLFALPASTAIAGQSVTFSFGGVVPAVSAVTDASGVAQVTVTYPQAGNFAVTASFANLADYFVDANGNPLPTTASGAIAITP